MNTIKKWLKARSTMMIVPQSGGSIKQYQFNPFTIKAIGVASTLLIIALFSYGYFMTSVYQTTKSLNQTYLATIAERDGEITALKTDIDQKQLKIDDLKADLDGSASYFEEKVAEISVLESELQMLVSQFNEQNHVCLDVPVSRSGTLARDALLLTLPETVETHGEDVISDEITKQLLSYSELATDIEEKLDFLDARPDKLPTKGRMSSKFGSRRDPMSGRTSFHKGIDLANSNGTSICAAGAGVVTVAEYKRSYGNVIVINHGYGYSTLYAHCSSLEVEAGEHVSKGQLIAKMGSTGKSTGSHLHFEIHYDNTPIDPLTILKQE